MKKLFLLQLLTIALLGLSNNANAQGNLGLLGPRLVVDQPSGIAGIKVFTHAFPQGWARDIDSTWYQVDLVSAVDELACGSIASVTGKWVLIKRGTCEFGAKALNAQQAGAKGVIIYNHTPAQPLVNMAAGAQGASVTIPVLFISNEDGAAIKAQLDNSQTVKISITKWGFGFAHDLAIVPASEAMTPAGAMPIYQFDNTDVAAYRGYTGAFVANVGTSNETGVKLKSTVTFNPASGGSSVVNTDSVIIGNFNTSDSILQGISPRYFTFNPSGIGRYDINYNVTYAATDDLPADNQANYSFQVTPNAFCKGRLNSSGLPISSAYFKSGAAGASLTWGPLFYVRKGGYTAEQALFSISDGDTSKHSLAARDYVDLYMFKWVDGSGGFPSDGIAQGGELTLKSIAIKKFTEADSNGHLFAASFGDSVTGANKAIVLEDNSWYWVAVNLQADLSLGCDRDANYYNRSNAAINFSTSPVKDFWAPNFLKTVSELSSTDSLRMIPFGVTNANAAIIDSATYSSVKGTVPSLMLVTSVFPTNIKNTTTYSDKIEIYPNPGSDVVNVKFDLDRKYANVDIKVIDGIGRTVYSVNRKDIKNEVVNLSVNNYTAGNYYAVIVYDGKVIFKPFTVVSK